MRGRTLLVWSAAVLGAVSGVAAAFAFPELLDAETADPPAAGNTHEPPQGAADPLGLGIPLQNLDCSSQSVLILRTGTGFPALQPAVANNPDLDLKYLRPEESCDTMWVPPGQPPPDYVVYTGPYDSPAKPCEMRLTARHKRTMVLRLIDDVPMYVKCVCVLPYETFPELSVDGVHDARSSVYAWQLQNALARLDEVRRQQVEDEPEGGFRWRDMTSVMDQPTEERVQVLQAEVGLEPTGVVDEATWHTVTDLTCKHFEW